jgi:hypothetical protein
MGIVSLDSPVDSNCEEDNNLIAACLRRVRERQMTEMRTRAFFHSKDAQMLEEHTVFEQEHHDQLAPNANDEAIRGAINKGTTSKRPNPLVAK